MVLSSLKSAASSAASSITAKRSSYRLEIRPTPDYILYRGDPENTVGTKLTGHVLLKTTEDLKTRGIRIIFEGMRKTWYHPETLKQRPSAMDFVINKTKFLRQEYQIIESSHSAKTIPKGMHEWSFEFNLPGDLPESIEGMWSSFLVYNLRVVVDRGAWAKDLVQEKHMRVIRTLDQESTELTELYSIPDTWPDKVQYNFTVPSQSVVYGTTLFTDVELIPLREKLKFTRIETKITEILKVKREAIHTLEHEHDNYYRSEYPVVEEVKDIPEDSEEIDPETLMPVVKFTLRTPLPRSLSRCRQDVRHNQWIVIKHHVYHSVFIRNPPSEEYPEGHESKLRVNYALNIFISPNLPIGENNEVAVIENERSEHDSNLARDMQAAPPIYSSHRLDRLFDDVDTSGYFTPGPWSGAQTPYHPNSLSRRGSSENLSALTPAMHALTSQTNHPHQHHHHSHSQHTGPSALALERRLTNLQVSDGASEERHRGGIGVGGANSPSSGRTGTSTPTPVGGGRGGDSADNERGYFETSARARENQNRQGSDQTTPIEYVEYDMEALEHRPSYDTAVRTEVTGSFAAQPPTYGETMTPP